MLITQIIQSILNTLPKDILFVPESLSHMGITPEIKLSYYLYKQLTKRLLEVDVDFQIADTYKIKKEFFQKDVQDLQDNKVTCKHINTAYKILLESSIYNFKQKGINLDIKLHIQQVHPDAEITHSDFILTCNKKNLLCNPISDVLESKSEYILTNFAKPLNKLFNQEYTKLLKNIYGSFYSLNKDQLKALDIAIGDNFRRNIQK